MDYHVLLDLATELGYQLAMSGAETFRVEESITRLLSAYGLRSETFAIPNYLHVSVDTPEGQAISRMRRIGYHGNDLDSVERYNAVCRRICAEVPQPAEAAKWLKDAIVRRRSYRLRYSLMAHFTGAFGFCLFFGGTLKDALLSGLCGIIVGISGCYMDKYRTNQFFRVLISSFLMSLPAYALGVMGLADNTDAVIIGALMLLVPGLLFTNAMRDIIFGDTNSGINRIVQVLLVAVALALGTAASLHICDTYIGVFSNLAPVQYNALSQVLICFIGCMGFAVLFNVHGPGILLCAAGGCLTWLVYLIAVHFGQNLFLANLLATLTSALYAETMARIRKYPAISYLVVSIFPLLPGAGIYYTMRAVVHGDMEHFSRQGYDTLAIAGAIAVGILIVTTMFRMYTVFKNRKH